MTDPSTLGLPVDPAVRALILVEERLRSMEAHAQERAEAQTRLEAKVDTQHAALSAQFTQLATDMAVLKSQHDSFWRAAAILFGTLSLIGGAIGFVVSQAVQWFHK